jgi:hypothetical protein
MISNMGVFSETDLAVLTSTLSKDLSDYDSPDVELVVSPLDNAAASANDSTCLQFPPLDALTRSGDYGATFSGALRAFVVPGLTLTSWHFAALPHRIMCG